MTIKTKLLLLLLFIRAYSAYSQNFPEETAELIGNSPCNCDAALRYDNVKMKEDFYSDLSFGKTVYQLKNSARSTRSGVGFSIGKIGFDLNSDKARKASSLYEENMFNNDVMQRLTDYESRVTSESSYKAFSACIEDCFKQQTNNLDAFIISEGAENVVFRIIYNNQAGGTIKVTYRYGKTKKSIRVRANTTEEISVTRSDNKAFDVIFSAEGTSFNIEPKRVRRFEPAERMFIVKYDIDRKQREPGTLFYKTANNHYHAWKRSYVEETVNPAALAPDVHVFLKRVGKLTASNVFMVVQAQPGETLEDITVSYQGPKGWRDPRDIQKGFIRKDRDKVVYNIACWSKPSLITLNFTRVLNEKKTVEYQLFAGDNKIEISIPKDAINARFIFDSNGEKVVSFEGNGFIVRQGEPKVVDELKFYSFKINEEALRR